ncbi:hypothetical protein DEO72_LG5g2170 [Vigna unguiculata]|uniref:Uncharacterized protein n=1 Tax=Vigna unguiculata TaxID=3917 RepID=A0A4D6M0M3_VIGUN|nr:hypothetical protein DEO72_LG5g2170 [Vigna unguiculata]
MGFTLPHTRLAFKHLRPLSCQRLGPLATLTTRIIPNSSIPVHTIRYYMHIHILHTLNRVLHPIIQPTTKNMERIAIEQIPAPVSLKPGIFAQAKEVFRSSYKPSLRRDCQQRALQVSRVLAWTSPPRLSETAIRSKVRSLPRVLAEARPSRLSEIPHHSK